MGLGRRYIVRGTKISRILNKESYKITVFQISELSLSEDRNFAGEFGVWLHTLLLRTLKC